MQDRTPTKPNRYAVYDDAHNFLRYEYHERADEPTQVGDALNKANLLPDAVATALGLTGNPQVGDALQACAPWKLLQVYSVAGSYTFTPPSWCKEIGAFVIGGGGSGAGSTSVLSGGSVGGGGSGHTKTVIANTPIKSSYPVVVGTGGGTRTDHGDGFNGGTSSFDGITATGGDGGRITKTNGGTGAAANGGQGASAIFSEGYAPAFGEIRKGVMISGKLYSFGDTCPNECINPFDGKKLLIAGGQANETSCENGRSIYDDYGNYGSSGAMTTTGTKGTSYGCGGGGVMYSGSIVTIPGADGAVLIYGR